jgi:hypothetical protein
LNLSAIHVLRDEGHWKEVDSGGGKNMWFRLSNSRGLAVIEFQRNFRQLNHCPVGEWIVGERSDGSGNTISTKKK